MRLDGIIDAWVSGIIEDKSDYERRIKEVDGQIVECSVEEKIVMPTEEICKALNFTGTWTAMTVQEQRSFLYALCPAIIVTVKDELKMTLKTKLACGDICVAESDLLEKELVA